MSIKPVGIKLEEKPLERIIKLLPAVDARSMGGGQCSAVLQIFVRGAKGALSVQFYTLWYLEVDDPESCGGLGSYDYHSRERLDLSDTYIPECSFLNGDLCFCQGSSLTARDLIWPLLLEKGSEGVLDYLEKEYYSLFYSNKEIKTCQ